MSYFLIKSPEKVFSKPRVSPKSGSKSVTVTLDYILWLLPRFFRLIDIATACSRPFAYLAAINRVPCHWQNHNALHRKPVRRRLLLIGKKIFLLKQFPHLWPDFSALTQKSKVFIVRL